MTKPKYQIGDRVTVGGLSAEVTYIDYLQLSKAYLYLVRFDYLPAMQTLVTEKDIDDSTTT